MKALTANGRSPLPEYVSSNQEKISIKTGTYTKLLLWPCMLILEVIIYGSYSTLVKLTQEDGRMPYNSASVVVLIELFKFIISAVLYFPEFKKANFTVPFIPTMFIVSYAVPAVLYTFNNNIVMTMLLHMDPTTYQILCNLKIAATALLYKLIIKKVITVSQWAAIGLLMLAGVIDGYGGFEQHGSSGSQIYIDTTGIVLIITYCTVSGFAAVYTEYMLKRHFTTSLHLQNMLLYTYGLVFNITTFLWQSQSHVTSGKGPSGFLTGFSVITWLIVISQTFNGLIMSIVMKHGSNLTRLFIISGAMLTSTVLAMFVFNTAISTFFLIAAVLVIAAIYLYHY